MQSIDSVTSYTFPSEVSVLVLCAGTMGKSRFLENQMTSDGLDKCFQINFLAPALLCLKKPDSVHTVVFVSSYAANFIVPDGSALLRRYATSTKLKSYAASKCCMHIFFQIYRQRFPGTRCVCVDPGSVRTELVSQIYRKTSLLAYIKRRLRETNTFHSVEHAAKRIVEQVPMALEGTVVNAEAVYGFVDSIHLDPSYRKFYHPLFNNEHAAAVALGFSLTAPYTNLLGFTLWLCL
jgi:NAD(P)-dependent dehydrogenase (short-subunit alcohol dehydrogenase family)